jgi:hypothetical protein
MTTDTDTVTARTRLDQATLQALRDFYTNRMELITEVIEQARANQAKARAGYEAELASVKGQLAAKENRCRQVPQRLRNRRPRPRPRRRPHQQTL